MNEQKRSRPLLIALKAEKEAVNFYARMANRSLNPDGKKMIKKILGEEKKHMKAIEQRLKKMKASLDYSGILEKASILSEINFEDPDLSDIEVINSAIEDEKHAITFYTREAEGAAGQEEKEFYKTLSRDEESHMRVLERARLKLKKK
ncbi:MAG: ferritin family protein [Candidatus Margulisiibacteriota bacterium]|nr:ferritin family protein [Candidatus Margulisiibacteriota bacterium]